MLKAYLDQLIPFKTQRWITFALLILIFLVRVFHYHMFYIYLYALMIYILQLFLLFLSPKFLNENEGTLPVTTNDDEFRPFVRKLPEFQFWLRIVSGTLLCCIISIFPSLDVPVYWPILVIYFFLLLFLTMRKQVQHMIQYRYIPMTIGKKKYSSSRDK